MNYELDEDLKRIQKLFKKSGYSLLSTVYTTTSIKDTHGKPINAYTEPLKLIMQKEDFRAEVEFYLRHERKHSSKLIKALVFDPQPTSLCKAVSVEIMAELL